MLLKIGCLIALVIVPVVTTGTPVVAQQEIKAPDGSLFMEEVPTKQPKRQAPPVHPIDLSELGVPTSSSGHIVPHIQNEPGGVMPLGSNLSIYGQIPASALYELPAIVLPWCSIGYLPRFIALVNSLGATPVA